MKVRFMKKLQSKLTKSVMFFVCPLALAAVMVASLAVAGAIFSDNTKTVMISDGSALYELTADCDTVSEALSLVGIEIDENEVLNCNLSDSINGIDVIRITKKIEYNKVEYSDIDTLVSFEKIDNEKDPIGSFVPGEDFTFPGVTPDAPDFITGEPTEEPEVSPAPQPVITVEYEDVIEEIPFGTTYVEDNSMLEGDSKVVTQGQVGIKTYVYEITLVDGVETERELVKVKDTKAPVNRVVATGTISNFLSSRGDKVAFTKMIPCKATAYTDDEKWGNKVYWTSQLGGLTTRWGVIAVDPNVIPLGTLVYVKGTGGTDDYGYAICADIGGSIKGKWVDLWMDYEDLCNTWGIRQVEVYILEDQSCDVFALRGNYEWEP